MPDADKEMIDDDDQQQNRLMDSEQDDELAGEATRPKHPVAVFSVAQALSMVRQRREEQDRTRHEEEKRLEEQRREKAKEKWQRRRKNQKERKAQSREAAANSPAPMATATAAASDDVSKLDKQCCLINEDANQARGLKRLHDHETGDDGMTDQKTDDEINLKRLPVKKRLRLKSSEKSPINATPELKDSEPNRTGTTAVKKVTTLLPRALLLKSSKR